MLCWMILVLHAETKKYDSPSKLMYNNINIFTFVRLGNIELDYTIRYMFYFFSNIYYIEIVITLS